MVDRYTITANADDLEEILGLSVPPDYIQRYNAAPTQFLPVVTSQSPNRLVLYQWGLISNLSNNKKLSPRLFNLPIESALMRPSYRKSLNDNRCMILADGFYLWKPIAKKQSIPYYFTALNNKPFFIAGIWEEGDAFSNNPTRTFMVITDVANSVINTYQEDMPLILGDNLRSMWTSTQLSVDDLPDLVRNNPIPEFRIHPVSPRISNIEFDTKEMILPTNPSDQHGNYTLFG